MPDQIPQQPYPMQYPMPPYPSAPAQYEFDMSENEVIAGLASAMRFVAIVSIVFGALFALFGMLAAFKNAEGLLTAGQGVLMILVGSWLVGAASGFRAVVATQGNDIANMMGALRKLRSVYKLQAILWGIAIAFIAVAIVIVAIAAGQHH